MTKRKILFFVSGSYIGGLEVMAFQLMKQLKKEGYDVYCIINGWNDKAFKTMLTNEGIQNYEVRLGWLYLRKPMWTLDTLLHLPAAYLKAKKIIKDIQPDLIHFHNFSNYLVLYPLIKVKAVYTLHEAHFPSRKINLIYKMLDKKINAFVGVSYFIKNCLNKLPVAKSKIEAIYNGIEISEEPGFKMKERDKITLGIVGHIDYNKGHELLLKAVQLLADKNYNFHVKVFGNTNVEYYHYLKKIIEEQKLTNYVAWMGFEKEKKKIYSQLDIVVVPTIGTEALSLTKMEAMYYYCPVIVSDTSGNPELVTNGVTGYIFKSGDAVDLAEKIEDFFKYPHKIDRMGQRAHWHIKGQSVEKMAKEYSKLYKKLLLK